MSTGALRELSHVSIEKFEKMITDVPTDDKKVIITHLKGRAEVLS